MKIDFQKSPEDFFFAPGTDPGLSLLEWPAWLWRTRPGGSVTGHAIGTYPHQREKVEQHIFNFGRFRQFGEVAEVNCIPAVLDDVQMTHSFASVQGRWFLNGAAGTRLRNRYAWKAEGSDDAVIDYFENVATRKRHAAAADRRRLAGSARRPRMPQFLQLLSFHHRNAVPADHAV